MDNPLCVGEADDIRDEALLSNQAHNSLKGNSRHAPSWKTFEDQVMPAELDQEVMHWLQNQAQSHDSMSVR